MLLISAGVEPATSWSKAVLTAPLECSTCLYQRSFFSFRMRPRSSMPSHTCSSLDLVVTMSCGLTLQICPIIALSFHRRHWSFAFLNGQVSLAWFIALLTHELYTRPHVLKERWREERTRSSTLNFFQVFFTAITTLILLNLDMSCLHKQCRFRSVGLKKLTDLDLHCLSFSMWIYINNLDQVIWLAEN